MTKQFSNEELAQEAMREVEMRREVYGRSVYPGERMTAAQNRRIAMMQAIAEHFQALAAKERLL